MTTTADQPVAPTPAPLAPGSQKRALIVVDMQNDFMEGGALPVTGARALTPVINRLARHFPLTIGTTDWHPYGHRSFAENHDEREPGEVVDLNGIDQILWPVHCVQGTEGAAFVEGLETDRWAAVFRKGEDPLVDSYSGYFDNARQRETGLGDYLRQAGVREVYVTGVATDYCVRFTAEDARSLGFATTLITDACAGVNLKPGDVDRALDSLQEGGVRLATAAEVEAELVTQPAGAVS